VVLYTSNPVYSRVVGGNSDVTKSSTSLCYSVAEGLSESERLQPSTSLSGLVSKNRRPRAARKHSQTDQG